MKKANPKCPKCSSKKNIKKGSQKGLKRYFCKACRRSFSINHARKKPCFWIPHIDGTPIRKLSDQRGLSPARTYQYIRHEMNMLPNSNWITKTYCEKFCGTLIVDGKYIKVRGYKQKIPFIYGIDYLTHDIPVGMLFPSESTEAFTRFFRILKECNYPLSAVVCDDILFSLKPAIFRYFPAAKIQLCRNHYIENIRRILNIRTEITHQLFFGYLKRRVFDSNISLRTRKLRLHETYLKFAKHDMRRQNIIVDIYRKRMKLFAYMDLSECPKTTNLIELFNSHLNARISSIKGFKSLEGAKLFLNAYLLRRRTKQFTDCKTKFKHLNGSCGLELTIKKPAILPEILPQKALKSKR